jgi:UDP-2,3-diacylglucosamine hydrolase
MAKDSKTKNIFFISDLHFGAGTVEQNTVRQNKFYAFLNMLDSPQNILYIVGDLFDFWFEYKHAVPKKNFPVLFKLHQLIQNGVEIHFLPGNHDYWIHDFFQEVVGIIVHPEEYEFEWNSQRFYLFHGDGILKRDKGYRLLKRIFRNRLNIFLYRWLHPDLGIPLAQLTSHTSRKHTSHFKAIDDNDYLNFAQGKFSQGFNYVILGHSHQPSFEKIDNNYLINLGDWLFNFSYGKFADGIFTLNYWTR